MAKRKHITPGMVFHRLTIVERAGSRFGARQWRCLCKCGRETLLRSSAITNGYTKSCGCLGKECSKTNALVHGMTNSPEWTAWRNMLARCRNAKSNTYAEYGERGIAVCDRWTASFEAFFSDMGPRPSPGHSIDRKDNNGDYCPENCRWATKKEQMRNTRHNHLLTHNGETLTIAEWAERIGMKYSTLNRRLWLGWTARKAITAPLSRRPKAKPEPASHIDFRPS